MAKKKGPSVTTVALRNNNTGKVSMAQAPQTGVAGLGSNIPLARSRKKANGDGVVASRTMPSYSVDGRHSAFLAALIDPVHNPPALPPVSLNSRCLPLKQYQEVLLTTDANGAAAVTVNATMKGQINVAATITGSTISTYNTTADNTEYTSFASNFYSYFPVVLEVVLKFTGSMTNVGGRMYGIVGPNGLANLANFPLEPNGCEAITADGISCTWYSTSAVWNNPVSPGASIPTEWGSASITCGIIGGPASASNIVTAGVYLHLAAVPNNGICGLTPISSIPDPAALVVSGLMNSATSGLGASSTSAKKRDQMRKRKAMIRDVLKIGGKVVGTVMPHLGMATDVAEAIAMMLV